MPRVATVLEHQLLGKLLREEYIKATSDDMLIFEELKHINPTDTFSTDKGFMPMVHGGFDHKQGEALIKDVKDLSWTDTLLSERAMNITKDKSRG